MPKLTCKFYAVGCADAISVGFDGDDGQKHHLLIDSGWEESYDLLKPELVGIAQRGEAICLWVITHWDNDHIGGILNYMRDDVLLRQKIVQNFWFNANYRIPKTNKRIVGYVGLKEGVLLRDAIQKELGILVPIITTATPSVNLFGVELTILSPSLDIYQKAIAKIQLYAPTSAKAWDYSEKIEALAAKSSPPDRSLENRSSIAFLLKYRGYKLLFLADASPIDLVSQLREMGYSEANRLSVDFVKVAHHGSKRNTSKELLSLIETDKFIFTADGSERYKLPNKETISYILCHRYRDASKHIKLFFNHRSNLLESIFDVDGEDVYKRLNFSVHFVEPKQNALTIHFDDTL
jgi:beta-lactamase superfamily II metal-dependent hydrolase